MYDFETTSLTDPDLMMHIEMKMKNIKNIELVIKAPVNIEERYVRGKVRCVIATSNKKFTICFINGSYLDKDVLVPMSLLYGNLLHKPNIVKNVLAKEIL